MAEIAAVLAHGSSAARARADVSRPDAARAGAAALQLAQGARSPSCWSVMPPVAPPSTRWPAAKSRPAVPPPVGSESAQATPTASRWRPGRRCASSSRLVGGQRARRLGFVYKRPKNGCSRPTRARGLRRGVRRPAGRGAGERGEGGRRRRRPAREVGAKSAWPTSPALGGEGELPGLETGEVERNWPGPVPPRRAPRSSGSARQPSPGLVVIWDNGPAHGGEAVRDSWRRRIAPCGALRQRPTAPTSPRGDGPGRARR